MANQFVRTQLLIGQSGLNKLKNARIAVFGIGGVGGHCAEALARAGVGTLDIFDDDKVCLSNLNRQIFALHSTLGQYKTDAAAARLKDINPNLKLNCHKIFYSLKTASRIDLSVFDFVLDAIDTVSCKIELILNCQRANVPIICSMGTGNKLSAVGFEFANLFKTSVCPLAKVMRNELKKRGGNDLMVVYSKEQALKPIGCENDRAEGFGCDCSENNGDNDKIEKDENDCESVIRGARGSLSRRQTPASISFVPPISGLIMAGEAIKYILNRS